MPLVNSDRFSGTLRMSKSVNLETNMAVAARRITISSSITTLAVFRLLLRLILRLRLVIEIPSCS